MLKERGVKVEREGGTKEGRSLRLHRENVTWPREKLIKLRSYGTACAIFPRLFALAGNYILGLIYNFFVQISPLNGEGRKNREGLFVLLTNGPSVIYWLQFSLSQIITRYTVNSFRVKFCDALATEQMKESTVSDERLVSRYKNSRRLSLLSNNWIVRLNFYLTFN